MELSGSTSLVISNALTREGLSRILSDSGFNIAQSISSIDEIIDCHDHDQHIIIVDYTWNEKSIDTDIQNIINKFPKSKLVILRDDFDLNILLRIFFAGAHGYIIKDIAHQAFIAKMHLILMDEKVAPSNLIDSISTTSLRISSFEDDEISMDFGLNEREKDILQRLIMGQPNKLISRELGVSEATVKVSIQSIFRKMSVNNRTQAAILANECKIITNNSTFYKRKSIFTLILIATSIFNSIDTYVTFS